MDHFGSYVEDLSVRLGNIQQDHESERKALVDVKNTLKNSPGFCKMVRDEKRACVEISRHVLKCGNID